MGGPQFLFQLGGRLGGRLGGQLGGRRFFPGPATSRPSTGAAKRLSLFRLSVFEDTTAALGRLRQEIEATGQK